MKKIIENYGQNYVDIGLSSGTINDHEYVDLDLPSGILWATCNVGAKKPRENGQYIAWGEVKPKDIYLPKTYKHFCIEKRGWIFKEKVWKIAKYCTNSGCGVVDNKTTLELSDDAANVNWGGSWRMPTRKEFEELIDYCTWEWAKLDGKNGCVVTGPNGNRIFLPAAGAGIGGPSGDFTDKIGEHGSYYTSSLSTFCNAFTLDFVYRGLIMDSDEDWLGDRRIGRSIRPVSSPLK